MSEYSLRSGGIRFPNVLSRESLVQYDSADGPSQVHHAGLTKDMKTPFRGNLIERNVYLYQNVLKWLFENNIFGLFLV